VSGTEGNFSVSITQYPRYVDVDKCIACDQCAEKCPKKVVNEYNGGLNFRKAAYLKYPQAVPLKYALDPDNCIYLIKGRCRVCEKVCPTDAINFEDQKKEISLEVGAVILACGGDTYDPANHDTFGYGKHPNIVTSMEFERMLSASGPYGGRLVRPSDKKEPEKIAWLQCVGSRDEHLEGRGYCSTACCTIAVKEAMLAKENSKNNLDAAVFYIDIRTQGKGSERYFNRAKDDVGVRFIKSKVTSVTHIDDSGKNRIRYIDAAGKRKEEDFDIVVLSVGLTSRKESADFAKKLGVELNRFNFTTTNSFHPNETSRAGIYVCGLSAGPKNIPSSVIGSSAAAGVAGSRLSRARWTLAEEEKSPSESDIRGETPRIGVFVCRCGTNIAAVVDVPDAVEHAKQLPGVVFVDENMFACAQDSLDRMAKTIKEQRLNRVVVAACTPRTHEPLFQQTMTNSGLNKYLFEMANIRNQCSWVHKKDPARATEKAKDLIQMAVSKAWKLEPLPEPTLTIDQHALVIGGGVAGMTAARTLSDYGYPVYLIEREDALGGNARRKNETWRGENIQHNLTKLIEAVSSDKNITVHLNSRIKSVDGFIGNFKTTISQNGADETLEHGVAIVASGASELKPDDHLYGKNNRVITALEFQDRLIRKDPGLGKNKTAVFLQCVGSRIPERPYCSRVCCTRSVKSAIELKSINPQMNVFILYRQMRAYGFREILYREARSKGIVFIRYTNDEDVTVEAESSDLRITFTDTVLRRRMEIHTDLLVLATAIIQEQGNPLAQRYKVSQNIDGFFIEAHVKLRPVDFATDGVFVCGLAHAPKPIDESIAQAQAAAGRSVAILSSKTRTVSGTIAAVNAADCSRCGVCVSVCPYGAPVFNEKTGKAEVQSTLCKGCGLCVASCRSGAIHQKGFETDQIMSMIEYALFPQQAG